MTMVCPHCSAMNESASQFCTSCGKALPSEFPSQPRIVSNKEFATSRTGQMLQLEEMRKLAKTAFNVLLTIAILQLIAGGALLAVSFTGGGYQGTVGLGLQIVAVFLLVIAAIFLTLAFWARHAPLPAAITGLALYGSLTLAGLVLDSSNVRGLFIPILICVALGKAVSAGVKHRALKRHMAA